MSIEKVRSISKRGDVRVYSQKELRKIFCNCGFKSVQVYRKGSGVFLKAEKSAPGHSQSKGHGEQAEMRFEYTDGSIHDFIALCRGLDEFLNECAGGEENRAEYVPYNRLDDIHDVVIAYDGDIPVVSAAFKKYDDECAEVKRIFIKQEYRNRESRKS